MKTALEFIGLTVLALVSGFGLSLLLYYLLVGKWLCKHIFNQSLQYIRANGCGEILEENRLALDRNLSLRIALIYVITTIMAILLSFPIGLYYRYTGSLLICFGPILGLCFGITTFCKNTMRCELQAVTFVGRLVKLESEDKAAIFETDDGCKLRLSSRRM